MSLLVANIRAVVRAGPGKAHSKLGGMGQCWATQDRTGTGPSVLEGQQWRGPGNTGRIGRKVRHQSAWEACRPPSEHESWMLSPAGSLTSAQTLDLL